jgi:hypothetical protein
VTGGSATCPGLAAHRSCPFTDIFPFHELPWGFGGMENVSRLEIEQSVLLDQVKTV